MDLTFNPQNLNLSAVSVRDVICYLELSGNDYNGYLGERISSVFVILIVSTLGTLFPVIATRIPKLRIPLYVFLFARYFGSGVIIATAFIHLLDPGYAEIGPNTCVGMTGNWAVYSWPPALAMTAVMVIFLMNFLADYYVENKYKSSKPTRPEVEDVITGEGEAVAASSFSNVEMGKPSEKGQLAELAHLSDEDIEREFKERIAAFLILEFGIIFHSAIIGLTLGTIGEEFFILYPVIVFHQTFEGLGIGARLSAIAFPKRLSWMPYMLVLAYGLTTPIGIAVGLGVRNSFSVNSFNANIVAGIFDSMSAGILIYTGVVEMLARDFIFNPQRSNDKKRLAFMLISLYAGCGLMAVIGKWA